MTKAEKRAPHSAGSKRQILVVSDSLEINNSLRDTLINSGYSIVFTENGLDALSSIRSRPFDIIITRLRMPAMDGLELIMNLKDLRIRVPVIIIEENLCGRADADLINVVGYCCNPQIKEELIEISNIISSNAR